MKRLQARYDMDRKEYMREYFKNPENMERHKKAVYKSHAKKFVEKFATSDDMNELIAAFNYR